MTTPAEPLPELVNVITASVTEEYPDVTAEVVASVLRHAANAAETYKGDAIGTMRRSPNGDVADRVYHNDIPMWRIRYADGSAESYDMSPTLDWQLLYSPPEE